MDFVKKIVSMVLCAAVLIAVGVTLVGCGAATTPAPTTKPTATTDTKPAETKTVDGKFESMDQDKGVFIIKDKDDKEVKFEDVKDLIKDFKKDDYKKGETKVKVTTDKDGKKATKIEKM